jgi:integrase
MADTITRQLNDAAVRNAKPAPKPYKLTDGGGLFLLVQPNGAKLWRFKFRLAGKEGLHAIGAYPDVNLAAARNEHRQARELVAAGQNPGHCRKAEREREAQARLRANAGAFVRVVESWQATSEPGLAPLTIRQRRREVVKYLLPAFKSKTIEAITRADAAGLLKRTEARAPEVARNLRNYLSAIFEHAIDVGLVSANPVPPARVLRRRDQVSHAAMSLQRLPDFLAMLEASKANPETLAAMRLVVLTVCRKSEVCGARWCEFDLDAATWTIPAERMKARREHWVPLSRQAVELLRELRKLSAGEFLFPHRDKAGQPMADRSLNALLERSGFKGETVHGFRSVFSTHYNRQGVSSDVIERCLAHAPADKVRAAYNRHQYKEERRELLQAWADFIDAQRLQVDQAA